MSDLDPAPSRKRQATRQLTKDDIDAGNVSPDEDLPSEPRQFQRADPETLKSRQRVTVRRQGSKAGGGGAAALNDIFEKKDSSSPVSVDPSIIPKPTVSAWAPVSLNFAKATGATPAAQSKSTADSATPLSSTPTPAAPSATLAVSSTATIDKPAALPTFKPLNLPAAPSAKPAAAPLTSAKPAAAPLTSAKPAATTTTTAPSQASSAFLAALSGSPTAPKPNGASPFSTGFKFSTAGPSATASTTASSSSTTASSSSTTASSSSTTASASSSTTSAPAATSAPIASPFKYSFLGATKPAELKATPLNLSFAKPALEGTKPGFLFGQNIAPPKQTAPSANVIASVQHSSDDDDPSSKLLEGNTAPTNAGEENENVLFKADAKLAEYDTITKVWTDRGVGLFKLNQFKDDHSRTRLVMHAKSTLKLTLNTPVYVGMPSIWSDKTPNVIKFSGIPVPDIAKKPQGDDPASSDTPSNPSSSDTPALVVFNLRFRDSETAALAHKTLNEAIAAKSGKSSTTTPSTTTTDSNTVALASTTTTSNGTVTEQTSATTQSSDASKPAIAE